MLQKDILVLGPTSSGKTVLATYLASFWGIPIFNSDAIQVYNDLDYLSNKPLFIKQELNGNGNCTSLSKVNTVLKASEWSNFELHIFSRKSNRNVVSKVINVDSLQEEVCNYASVEVCKSISRKKNNEGFVVNYLFDVREPMQQYSVSDFIYDVERISVSNDIKSKIICGGTIYYVYHYLSGTKFGGVAAQALPVTEEFRNWSKDELLAFLKQYDSESLNFIDQNNKKRLIRAVESIKQTGQKFSDSYNKESSLKGDFLVILIYPKNREEYYKNLDTVIEKRINQKAIDEIGFLLKTYGQDIRKWLEAISYEYRYSLKIYDFLQQNPSSTIEGCHDIIQELKFKEHQYAKRQITFMRKLERKLSGTY